MSGGKIHDFPHLKLDSVIGFNGRNPNGIIVHPDREHIIYYLGFVVIVENINTQEQSLLSGHHNDVSCLAVSKLGRYIASGQTIYMGFKADIIVWNYETKSIHCRFTLHKVKVHALDISPNEKFLLSLGGQDDGSIVLWDISAKEAICGSPAQAVTAGISLCCKFSNTSDFMFITGGEYCLRVWELDVKNHKIRPTEVKLRPYKRIIQCIAVEEDDSYFYCGTTTGDILCVTMRTSTLAVIGPPKKLFSMGVQSLLLVKTGGHHELLAGAGDGTVAIVKDKSSKFQRTKKSIKLNGSIMSLSLRGSGHQFFVGTSKSNLYRFNYMEFTYKLLNTGHSSAISDIIFPADVPKLFLTCGAEQIRVWHTPSQKELLRIVVNNMTCNALDISKDGSVIVSAWNDGRIRGYYPESGKLMYQIENAHNRGVTSIAFISDASRIISGGGEGQVRIWEVSTGYTQKKDVFKTKLIESMKEHKGCVTQIKVFPNDHQCVSVSTDGTCVIWNLENYQRDAVLFANTLFQCACVHPECCQVITSGTDRNVAYWEVIDGLQIRSLEGAKSGSINAMDISADGKYFITGGDDHLLKMWDYDEGRVIFVGIGHGGSIKRVKISPDQKFIISVGDDGAILQWENPIKNEPIQEENTEDTTKAEN